MDYTYYAFAVLFILAGALIAATAMRLKTRKTIDPLVHLKELIKQGVVYEDEFVDVYFKVIRDEGFMENFGEHKEEALQLLTTMIEESKGHKSLLENVMANLK